MMQLLHRLAGRQRGKTGLHFAVSKWIWKLITFRDPPARIMFGYLIRCALNRIHGVCVNFRRHQQNQSCEGQFRPSINQGEMMKLHRSLPVIPETVLNAHKVNEKGDTRFKSAARLLQSLWRESMGHPIGSHRNADGKRRKLGSRLNTASAKAGANFLTPDIANLTRREVVYREVGAFIDEERLWTNLLSSQPLCFNLFGALKLDMAKANLFFCKLFPDYVHHVEGIYFEHSPGRGDPMFTQDNSAFDVFVTCITPDGESAFIAIEMKYSETMTEPPAKLRPRYDELSAMLPVFRDSAAPALRDAPLQQLWREHMLSRAMVENGGYGQGRFVVIHPAQNAHCEFATRSYQRQLVSTDPTETGFQSVTLEDCLSVLSTIGEDSTAAALHKRYLDFDKVDAAIFKD